MKHFITYVLLLVLGFLLVVTIISVGSLYSLRQGAFYKPSFLANQVQAKAFDYVILGASTGLTTLNTHVIDSINHMNGINLSMDDTGIASHYLMLQHFLAEGKTTDYCVLVPSLGSFADTEPVLGDNDYRFLMYINRDYVLDYYKSLPSEHGLNVLYHSKWMPFLGVSYYNAELFFPSLLSLVKPNKRNRFDNDGNYTYPSWNSELKVRDKTEKRIGFNNPYLKKIEDLCHQNNITLLYYFSPNRIQTVSVLGGVKKIMNHTDVFKGDLYFYDDIHVNEKGSKEASRLFANGLKLITEELF